MAVMGGDEMKCPLLMASETIVADDCREEKCAWWEEDSERCAVLMVAVDMDRAVSVVNDVMLVLSEQLQNLNANIQKHRG